MQRSDHDLMCRGLFAFLLGLAACGGDPEPPAASADSLSRPDTTVAPVPDPLPTFARRATAIELALDTYRNVDGAWEAGDASSVFTAHFEADTLRLIEENTSLGEYGESTTVYYFADGVAFYIVEDALRTVLDSEADRRSDTLLTRAAFGPEGRTVATERIVNGGLGVAPLVEVRGLWNHAQALAERARRAARPAL